MMVTGLFQNLSRSPFKDSTSIICDILHPNSTNESAATHPHFMLLLPEHISWSYSLIPSPLGKRNFRLQTWTPPPQSSHLLEDSKLESGSQGVTQKAETGNTKLWESALFQGMQFCPLSNTDNCLAPHFLFSLSLSWAQCHVKNAGFSINGHILFPKSKAAI